MLSWCRSPPWRSAWCGRKRRSAARGSLTACLRRKTCRSAWSRSWRCATSPSTRAPPPPRGARWGAAIWAVHAEAEGAEDTDWRQIASLYQRLYEMHASPVVALNHAVAVSMADGPRTALPLIEALEGDLAGYHLWHAARADLLRRLE